MQSRFLLSCWPCMAFFIIPLSLTGFGDERMRFHTRQHSISTLAFPQSMPTWTGKVFFVELWRLLKHRVLETTGQTRSNTNCPNWIDQTVLMEQREMQDVAPLKFVLRELSCLQNRAGASIYNLGGVGYNFQRAHYVDWVITRKTRVFQDTVWSGFFSLWCVNKRSKTVCLLY